MVGRQGENTVRGLTGDGGGTDGGAVGFEIAQEGIEVTAGKDVVLLERLIDAFASGEVLKEDGHVGVVVRNLVAIHLRGAWQ